MPFLKSLPDVCIALGFADPEELALQARREIEAGEAFLEFRLDYLRQPQAGVEAIRNLLEEHPECVVLATCRRRQNHGRFNGSIEEQVRLLQAAAKAGAKAVDLEIESAEQTVSALPELRLAARLIVSYHNFEGTPPLETVLRRLLRCPADAYKIVTMARKPSDLHRLLALAKAHSRTPIIVLAMGEIGFPSRVLSPRFGGLFTYAAPSTAEGTASGQVSARVLRHLYRLGKLSRSGKIYGVVADPVCHSISPAVHNRAFQARRIDAVYLPLLTPSQHLKDFMTLAEKLPITGFSVTIPHKQKILRYLDAVEPLARRIGALNTVWRKAGKWRGMNTDAAAVVAPLQRQMRLAKSSVLVIGSGGAARSAAFALVDAGAKVSISGRDLDRACASTLAKACGAEALLREQLSGLHFDALVHATPLGMYPRVEECFFEDRIPAEVVLDMVYNPIETLLLRRAREQGKSVVPGLHMFLEQAARQFEVWTGDSAPRSVMERAAREALGAHQV
jgi:3-dehydroquinate dehydratase/shikimate dehydrogenase